MNVKSNVDTSIRRRLRRTVVGTGVTALAVLGLVAAQAVPAQAAEWSFTCGQPAPYQFQSHTWSTGSPDRCMWAEMQAMGRLGGYTGPLDGVMGTNSWKGFQNYLKSVGLNPGVSDGVPGTNTYKAMQQFAAWHGYTGPIDGVMGVNSWKHFSGQLQVVYYGS